VRCSEVEDREEPQGRATEVFPPRVRRRHSPRAPHVSRLAPILDKLPLRQFPFPDSLVSVHEAPHLLMNMNLQVSSQQQNG
jgi:hypothetical protein